ncbi:CAP domain-containing protein [Paracoccus rhizosphaerae]|uniref:CAP domain-containing protein n=1 Tax=Paracoccus rhizosphaerae TaxID=1133347 RepID=A0ABV6CMK9_9RHOB|nr:CAP domain-containing protein [Paracoccus rhizosphaerae]
MSHATPAERYFLQLVNQERARHDLAPLVLEMRLNDSAAAHSRWMLEDDTFSHTGEGGSKASERVRDANFPLEGSWRVAENLALISDDRDGSLMDEVRQMHVNLMNSPGHRANILDPRVEYLGVGIEVGNLGSDRVVMVTQNFAATGGQVHLDAAPGVAITTVGAPMLNAPSPSIAAWRAQVGDYHQGPFATAGNDQILRGDGNDTVWGGTGFDWINGGGGADALHGGRGNDVIMGHLGNDRIWGDIGGDRLSGGAGNDIMAGGPGYDVMTGDMGDDRMFGGDHNDRLFGNWGADTLLGGTGNDLLAGGLGNDELHGGAGADQFVFAGQVGVDRIVDFQPGIDRILIDKDLVGRDVTDFVRADVRETDFGVVIDLGSGNRIALTNPNLSWQDVADDIFLF